MCAKCKIFTQPNDDGDDSFSIKTHNNQVSNHYKPDVRQKAPEEGSTFFPVAYQPASQPADEHPELCSAFEWVIEIGLLRTFPFHDPRRGGDKLCPIQVEAKNTIKSFHLATTCFGIPPGLGGVVAANQSRSPNGLPGSCFEAAAASA